MYKRKLAWLILILLLTCFNALLEKSSPSITEESNFHVTTKVDKEIPYERWWRDDTDYEQQQVSFHPLLSFNHLDTSTEIQKEQTVEKPIKASATPSIISSRIKSVKKETIKNPKTEKTPKIQDQSSVPKKKEEPSKEMTVSAPNSKYITTEDSKYFSLNQTKVMLMLGKFIKQYRIQSLVQGRCKPTEDTLEMIRLVERYPTLRFLGMHPDAQTIEKFKKQFGENLKLKFVVKEVMDEIPFGFDLMWNLEGIHDQPYETVLRFFVQLKRKKYKYVALIHVLNCNNEKVIRDKGTYIPINVRSKPFSLPMPLRMVKEVGKDIHGHSLQLLLYDISQLPDMENDEYLREFLSWIG